jgi:hypothetical protein
VVVKVLALAAFLFIGAGATVSAQVGAAIPATQATALAGQAVSLPRDLSGRATVLILGFGRHSQDATTAWEKPTRTQLARPGAIDFYDMAMLAEIPSFVRPFVLRAIRHAVPDVLKPNFLPLFDGEDSWKRAAGYDSNQPEAAYLLLVDRTGRIQWATHAPYTDAGFAELRHRAEALAAKTP